MLCSAVAARKTAQVPLGPAMQRKGARKRPRKKMSVCQGSLWRVTPRKMQQEGHSRTSAWGSARFSLPTPWHCIVAWYAACKDEKDQEAPPPKLPKAVKDKAEKMLSESMNEDPNLALEAGLSDC